jgi:two-component system, OmpR family, response regulator VicR
VRVNRDQSWFACSLHPTERETMKILIVDDDLDLVDLLGYALWRAGFNTVAAPDSPSALKLLDAEQPDLAILELKLGACDSFELLKDIRQRSWIPIVMLGERCTEDDQVRALELGADDYVTKPFSHRELIARLRANLRRRAPAGPPLMAVAAPLQAGPITLNPAEHAAAKDGQRLALTVTEFRLLHCLMTNAGTVVPTRAILKQVWGYDVPVATDVVRAAVHRLRRKLGAVATNQPVVHTVPGVGVMLKA